jgi:mercuric ion transport protein
MDAEVKQTTLTAATDRSQAAPATGRVGLVVAGGLLGALAASSCCIVPLVLFTLGIGGAWIGNLAALEPYQPYFLAVTAGFLGICYFLVYRQPKVACEDGMACARPLPKRIVKAALWGAAAIAGAAFLFPFVAPALLGV